MDECISKYEASRLFMWTFCRWVCVCAGLCVHACESFQYQKVWHLLMPLALKDRTRRQDIFLFHTQLCSAMENCRFLRKNKCMFAHALEEMRPVPESWTTTKGHYWEPGNPLPDQNILDLIERYAVSTGQLPERVQYQRAHRGEAKQMRMVTKEEGSQGKRTRQ